MQYTENHNFKLPDGTDRFNIQNENDNWESMDTLIDEYLPLSAGLDNALTGRLYINKIMDGTSAQSIGIHLQKNSVNRATLYGYYYEDGSTNSDFTSLVHRDTSGETLNGIRIYGAGNIHIGAAVTGTESSPVGGSILLRPYGISDNTNQAFLSRNGDWTISGQQIGGHPISTAASTAYTTVQTIAFTAGTWIILSFMDANVSASGTYNHRLVYTNTGSSSASLDKVTRTSLSSGGGSLNGYMFTTSTGGSLVVTTYVPAACTIRNQVWYTRIS